MQWVGVSSLLKLEGADIRSFVLSETNPSHNLCKGLIRRKSSLSTLSFLANNLDQQETWQSEDHKDLHAHYLVADTLSGALTTTQSGLYILALQYIDVSSRNRLSCLHVVRLD